MASNCSLIYSSAPAFSAGALCFLGCCVECCLGRLVECRLGIRVRAAGLRHAIWGDLGRVNLLNTCQIGRYKTGKSFNLLPLLDLCGTGAKLWQRFERRPSPSGYGQGKQKGFRYHDSCWQNACVIRMQIADGNATKSRTGCGEADASLAGQLGSRVGRRN